MPGRSLSARPGKFQRHNGVQAFGVSAVNDLFDSKLAIGAQLLSGLEGGWTRPAELPDLHGADVAAIDLESCDNRLRAGLGAGRIMRDGYITGISVAYRIGGKLHSLYAPVRHVETDNFDRLQVFAWLKHIFASVPRLI